MIHYQSFGERSALPVLVFVHGLTCALDDWAQQYEPLQQHHHCIAVDLRGHGQSKHLPGPYDIESLAADVAQLLRHLDIENAILIGHSMGTRVIVAAALQAMDRVTGLVFVDGSRQARENPQQVQADVLTSLQDDSTVPGYIEKLFLTMFLDSSDKDSRQHILQRATTTDPEIFRQTLAGMLHWDAARWPTAVESLTIPLLVMQSTNVDTARKRHQIKVGESTLYLDEIREHVPHAEIITIADAGHFTQLDAASEVNRQLLLFVRTKK